MKEDIASVEIHTLETLPLKLPSSLRPSPSFKRNENKFFSEDFRFGTPFVYEEKEEFRSVQVNIRDGNIDPSAWGIRPTLWDSTHYMILKFKDTVSFKIF